MNAARACERRRAPLSFALALFAGVGAADACAGSVLARVTQTRTVHVCIWPAYQGITYRDPRTQQLRGVDADLSSAFAADLGAQIVYVDSSFPAFIDDLLKTRCDVAMFGIAVTPQRSRAVRFTQPYLQSGIYAVTTRNNPIVQQWRDIDRPGVKVAVTAGSFIEAAMRKRLEHASLIVLAPQDSRQDALQAGRVDAIATDYPYAHALLAHADWARLVAPPQPLDTVPYAYAVAPGDGAWLATVDAFVSRIKRDGRLAAAAKRAGLAALLMPR